MHTSTIQLYTTATQDAAASIDVPDEGEILACQMSIYSGDINNLGDYAEAMLSFGSSSTFITNDARSVIHRVSTGVAGITSGFMQTWNTELMTYGDGLKVFAGERIYLHTVAASCTITRVHALLVIGFKSFQARRR